MNLQAFLKGRGNLTKERNMLLTALLLSGTLNLILSLVLVLKGESIVVIPPHLESSFRQKGGEVSASLIEEMSLFLVHLLFDVSPESVNRQFKMVLDQYVGGGGYDYMRAWFRRERDRVVEHGITTQFLPLEIEVKGLQAFVRGKCKKKVSGTLLEETFLSLHITWEMTSLGLKLSLIKEQAHA